MKQYRYQATFRAYDKKMTESFEYDKPVLNLGVIENRILSICNTAIIHSIIVVEQTLLSVHEYSNNQPIQAPDEATD